MPPSVIGEGAASGERRCSSILARATTTAPWAALTLRHPHAYHTPGQHVCARRSRATGWTDHHP